MTDKWIIGKKRESTVSDWKKLIIDFRDQFPYDPVSALIVETFANSIDSGATKIEMQIQDDVFMIIDNGKGMTPYQFKEYHNIASLTKRKGEGIGFAGVGAKTFIDRAKQIVTETKSKTFKGATFWEFIGKVPEWKPIEKSEIIQSKTGTYVEVTLSEAEDKTKLNVEFVKNVIYQFYNSILLGLYDVKEVTINDEIIEGWRPDTEDIESEEKISLRINKRVVKGFLIKTKNPVPEIFQGPSIVVYGKTVAQEWFKQYPINSEHLTGIIISDYLIEILRTSKSDFDRTAMRWKYYHNRVGKFVGEWLEKVGAKPKTTRVSSDMKQISKVVEKTINDLLKLPEFNELANKIFQNILRKQVSIASRNGTLSGNVTNGGQITKGTKGAKAGGNGVLTDGDREDRGIEEKIEGDTPIERVRRKIRGGISISFDEKPENLSEGWIDPSMGEVVINMGHPAWAIAKDLDAIVYHLLRTVFTTLIEEAEPENSNEIVAKLFQKLPSM
jgi:hypothetical protein